MLKEKFETTFALMKAKGRGDFLLREYIKDSSYMVNQDDVVNSLFEEMSLKQFRDTLFKELNYVLGRYTPAQGTLYEFCRTAWVEAADVYKYTTPYRYLAILAEQYLVPTQQGTYLLEKAFFHLSMGDEKAFNECVSEIVPDDDEEIPDIE